MTSSRASIRRGGRKAHAGLDQPGSRLSRLFQTALAHHQRNEHAEAEAGYRAILTIDPSLAMPWSNLAAILHETGRCGEAVAACREALSITPDHLNAGLNLATAQQKLGDFAGAAETYAAILARHPRRADLHKSYADALERSGRGPDAVAIYDALLAGQPTDTAVMMARAEALKHLGRMDAAIAGFADVVRLRPDDAAALSSLGILKAMHSLDNDLDVAAALCLKAATLKPDCAPIVNNLGVVLQFRGETDNALLVLRELVAQQPSFAPAHANIGAILSAKSRYDEAEDAFLEALRLDPNAKESQIELTKIRRHLCDWTHSADDAQTIRRLVDQGVNFMIVLMTVSSSGAEQLSYARAAMAKSNARRAPARPVAPIGARRLRIGYLSADFRDHPVGRLMPDVVRLHDRARFEIFGYSLGSGGMTPLRARFADALDAFIDLDKVSDAEAATRIVADGIDILVDLTGPTAGSRFEIVAQRPAPVQVSFLGLPGTAGADALDYIVADRVLVPPGSERFYHEKVVRLPHCYQPSDTARRTLSPPLTRAQCGLPETGFVFCSFNSPVKISPEVFDVWMRLLHAVEGSVLWLYVKAEKTRRNLIAAAAARGIAAERLVFTGVGSYEVYLTRMTCADLFLDTHPYAAGATCNDALWVGLPVVTCLGETYVSRMAGSLLTTLGLAELATTSLDAYEQAALRLATRPDALRDVRDRLDAARAASPLFDMQKFTKSLETAYTTMIRAAAEGALPTAFDVEEMP